MTSETRIATDWGWGFCSNECNQEKSENIGILRVVHDADILHQDYCENLLGNGSKKIRKL